MMMDKVVVVFGGSGFLGRHIVADLVRRGYGVKIVSRRPERGDSLRVMGHVGQICSVYGDIEGNPDLLEKLIGDSYAVVNAAGADITSRRARSINVNAKGSENLASAVTKSGVKKFIHLSTIGANDGSLSSMYLRSKYLGENAVRKAVPDAVILRPSWVVGLDNVTLQLIAKLIRMSKIFVLPHCGDIQPICATDLAKAVSTIIESNLVGATYEIAGSKIYNLRDIVSMIAASMKKEPTFLCMGKMTTKIAGHVFDSLLFRLLLRSVVDGYRPLMTPDQAETMCINFVSNGVNLFDELKIPTLSVAHFLRESDWIV